MSTNHDKYLVLRGKNRDIYFIQKRVSKKVSKIIGKEFIKKSLETSDIIVAREKRDKILAELVSIEAMSTNNGYERNNNLEDNIMSNESISSVNNEHEENSIKKPRKDGFLEEYLDMDYIKSLRFPTKDSLIESFDNNLLIKFFLILYFLTVISLLKNKSWQYIYLIILFSSGALYCLIFPPSLGLSYYIIAHYFLFSLLISQIINFIRT